MAYSIWARMHDDFLRDCHLHCKAARMSLTALRVPSFLRKPHGLICCLLCHLHLQGYEGMTHAMRWLTLCQNAQCMSLVMQDCTFDAVLDKATLDCLMNCEDGPGEVHAMLKEAHRVLQIGGR